MRDLRPATAEELDATRQVLMTAEWTGRRRGAFAVKLNGMVMTCVAIERMPDAWLPVALVVTPSMELEVMPSDVAPTKDMDLDT